MLHYFVAWEQCHKTIILHDMTVYMYGKHLIYIRVDLLQYCLHQHIDTKQRKVKATEIFQHCNEENQRYEKKINKLISFKNKNQVKFTACHHIMEKPLKYIVKKSKSNLDHLVAPEILLWIYIYMKIWVQNDGDSQLPSTSTFGFYLNTLNSQKTSYRAYFINDFSSTFQFDGNFILL